MEVKHLAGLQPFAFLVFANEYSNVPLNTQTEYLDWRSMTADLHAIDDRTLALLNTLICFFLCQAQTDTPSHLLAQHVL